MLFKSNERVCFHFFNFLCLIKLGIFVKAASNSIICFFSSSSFLSHALFCCCSSSLLALSRRCFHYIFALELFLRVESGQGDRKQWNSLLFRITLSLLICLFFFVKYFYWEIKNVFSLEGSSRNKHLSFSSLCVFLRACLYSRIHRIEEAAV